MFLIIYLIGVLIVAVFELVSQMGFKLKPFGFSENVYLPDLIVLAITSLFSWFSICGAFVITVCLAIESHDSELFRKVIIKKRENEKDN